MSIDTSNLALQSKAALEAMGYTVEPDGKVSQGSVVGKQYVPPSTWMLQLSNSGFIDPKTGGINPNFDWSGVDSTEPTKGFAVSGEFDPSTGDTNNSINWANLLTTGAVGATGAAAALPFLLGGASAAPTAGATSTLPSSAIDAGLFTAPSSVASGAVPAALAGSGDALATGAGSTLASMVPATTASSTAPSATSIVPNFIASNAPIAGASTATPTAAAATSFTAPSLINGMMSPKSAGIPSEFGQTPTDTVASNQSTTLPSAAISPSTTGVMQAPNTTSSMAFDAPGSTIGKITDSLGDVSKLLGNFSSGEKANRVVQGNATSRYDQQALADQTGRNQTESDALKKLAQTSYILSGGFKPQNTQITLNGQTRALPQIGQAPLPSSAAQMAGAQSLQDQLGARLAPGGTVAPSPKDEYGGTPGTAENIGSYGAVIAGMLPAAKTIYNMFS